MYRSIYKYINALKKSRQQKKELKEIARQLFPTAIKANISEKDFIIMFNDKILTNEIKNKLRIWTS